MKSTPQQPQLSTAAATRPPISISTHRGLKAVFRVLFACTTLAATVHIVERASFSIGIYERSFFACEVILIIMTLINLATMLPHVRALMSHAEAERLLRLKGRQLPLVDVVIATHKEPVDIIANTVKAALEIDYPVDRMRVFVINDGHGTDFEPRLRALYDGRYTVYRRDNNEGHKAGNINNFLTKTREDPSDLILILDADMCARKEALKSLVPYFLQNKRLGFVQGAQRFSPCEDAWCLDDEWACWYDVVQPHRDSIGVAVCLGTNFIIPRRVLDAVGGFPKDFVIEDAALALLVHSLGYETRYTGGTIAMGLGPPDGSSMVRQQVRYCEGNAQLVRWLLWDRALPDLHIGKKAAQIFFFCYYLLGPFVVAMMIDPFVRFAFYMPPPPGLCNRTYLPFIALATITELLAYYPHHASLYRRKQMFAVLAWPFTVAWTAFSGRAVEFVPTLSEDSASPLESPSNSPPTHKQLLAAPNKKSSTAYAMRFHILYGIGVGLAAILAQMGFVAMVDTLRVAYAASNMMPVLGVILAGKQSMVARIKGLTYAPLVGVVVIGAFMVATGQPVLVPLLPYY